jgi:hypothetical protein
VPITASVNRRTAGQAPVSCACRRAGRNRAADPSGAATIAASSNASSIQALTGCLRAVAPRFARWFQVLALPVPYAGNHDNNREPGLIPSCPTVTRVALEVFGCRTIREQIDGVTGA